ncbi:MAG: hypothetical protein CVU84_13950 [Firmicutes bacterium HGW-Firmicutes-1]|jgi:hypothetical protein|nr:MAG: hypothetical protein CVU84_13950 [Firmicutes bacterium HGW-Firmicutes-1]
MVNKMYDISDGIGYRHNKGFHYSMELQGEGNVMVVPDVALIQLGVETNNTNLQKAQEENTLRTQQVLTAIGQLGIEEKDLQTIYYNIEKQYDYIDGKQVDRGYRVSNILQVTVRNIDLVGEVVDTAVNNGANVVRGISFEVDDTTYYYQKALNLAVMNAVKKAESIASRMSIQLLHVPFRITEESYGQAPVTNRYFAARGDVETPIEAGQTQITARVKVVFSYFPM